MEFIPPREKPKPLIMVTHGDYSVVQNALIIKCMDIFTRM
jgi:hypothetical protein